MYEMSKQRFCINIQADTHMSIIQESQGLGNVVQSENAVRRRPKPVKLT